MKYKAIITDVDNTLFDWFEIWYKSFNAMIDVVSEVACVSRSDLYPHIKKIHQLHGTSEYAYLLEDLTEVLELDYGKRKRIIIEGNLAFSETRKKSTFLYSHVYEVFSQLKNEDIKIIAFTESFPVYTAYRFKACGLDGIVDSIYAPTPHKRSISEFAQFSHSHDEDHVLERTVIRHTPAGETKPNPKLLRSIVDDLSLQVADCLYVGDSKMKDIAMAQSVGMHDAWAAYGQVKDLRAYELLKTVTHWPDSAVAKEGVVNSSNEIVPMYELRDSFLEIMSVMRA